MFANYFNGVIQNDILHNIRQRSIHSTSLNDHYSGTSMAIQLCTCHSSTLISYMAAKFISLELVQVNKYEYKFKTIII